MMWEAAAAKITERGGRILMGRELAELAYDDGPEDSGASRSRPRTENARAIRRATS